MPEGLVIHARANPLAGIRPALRRARLAKEWVQQGGHAVVAARSLPERLKWQLNRNGCRNIETADEKSPESVATELWGIAGRNRIRLLVADDASPSLVEQLARQKPANCRLTILGTAGQRDNPLPGVDFATENRPAFAVVRNDESGFKDPESCRTSRNERGLQRVVVDLSQLEAPRARRIALQLIDRFGPDDGSLADSGSRIEFVSPRAREWMRQVDDRWTARGRFTAHRNVDRILEGTTRPGLVICGQPEEFYELAADEIPCILLTPDESQPADLKLATDLARLPACVRPDSRGCGQKIGDLVSRVFGRDTEIGQHAKQLAKLVDRQGSLRLCGAIAELAKSPAGRRIA